MSRSKQFGELINNWNVHKIFVLTIVYENNICCVLCKSLSWSNMSSEECVANGNCHDLYD